MGVKLAHTLKQLESRRAILQGELAGKRQAVADMQRDIHATTERLRMVDAEIARLQAETPAGPIVSEHALLRYLARVQGVDLDAVRSAILANGVAEQINALKRCRLPIGNGAVLIVEDRVVKTVETSGPAFLPKYAKAPKKRPGPKPAQQRALESEED